MLWFLLAQAAVVVWFRSNQLGDPYYTYRAAALRKHLKSLPGEDPFRILLLGSSRIHQGLAARVIEEEVTARRHHACFAFNFGIPSGGPIASRLYLRRLAEEGFRPHLVMIEIYPITLAATGDRPLETGPLDPERIRSDEIPLLSDYGFDAAAIREEHWQVAFNPWERLRFKILERVQHRLVSSAFRYWRDFDRWGGLSKTPEQLLPELREKRIALRAEVELAPIDSWQPSPHADRALRDVLEYCQKERIHVLLIYMPNSSEEWNRYSPIARDAIRLYLETLQAEWQVPLIDARDWLPDSAFYDTVHVYADPAEQISKRMCREHLLPYLRRTSLDAP